MVLSETIINGMRPLPAVPVLNAQTTWLLENINDGFLHAACYGPPVKVAVMQRMGKQYYDYWRPVDRLPENVRGTPTGQAEPGVWEKLPDEDSMPFRILFAPDQHTVVEQSVNIDSFLNGAARRGWLPRKVHDQYTDDARTGAGTADNLVVRGWFIQQRQESNTTAQDSNGRVWKPVNGHTLGGQAMYCMNSRGVLEQATAAGALSDLKSIPTIAGLQNNLTMGSTPSDQDIEYFIEAQKTLFAPALLQTTEDQTWSTAGRDSRVGFGVAEVTNVSATDLFADVWTSVANSEKLKEKALASMAQANATITEQTILCAQARQRAIDASEQFTKQNEETFRLINETNDALERARRAWEAAQLAALLGPECEWYDSWCAAQGLGTVGGVLQDLLGRDVYLEERSHRVVRLVTTVALDFGVLLLFPLASCVWKRVVKWPKKDAEQPKEI
jgi:hypothetical protein